MRLGYCRECGASYEAPVVTDGLCPPCQRDEARIYRNDPGPYIELTREFSIPHMREKLGISGDEDV